MSREFPMNPSPVGKPSVSKLTTPKAMGSFDVRPTRAPEFQQTSAPTSTSSKAGAQAASKGKFNLSTTPGSEYRQVSSC